jgi:hypothetical protein
MLTAYFGDISLLAQPSQDFADEPITKRTTTTGPLLPEKATLWRPTSPSTRVATIDCGIPPRRQRTVRTLLPIIRLQHHR